jgi:hypothetical protein
MYLIASAVWQLVGGILLLALQFVKHQFLAAEQVSAG